MEPHDNADLLDQLSRCSLPADRWDHDAHLRVCQAALEQHGPDGALTFLRSAIRAFNESTCLANSDTTGYHETITRYYVQAVSFVATTTATASDVARHPACTKQAPLWHWSTARLFSAGARREWLEPDLVPLPWSL